MPKSKAKIGAKGAKTKVKSKAVGKKGTATQRSKRVSTRVSGFSGYR